MSDIVLTGRGEQEIATTSDLLVTPMCIIGWKRNATKIQATSVKVSGVLWCGECADIPSKVKGYLLHLAPPTTKKEEQSLVGPPWRQHILQVDVLLQPIYLVTGKAAGFRWSQG